MWNIYVEFRMELTAVYVCFENIKQTYMFSLK